MCWTVGLRDNCITGWKLFEMDVSFLLDVALDLFLNHLENSNKERGKNGTKF